MTCASCGAEIAGDARFCPQCGAAVDPLAAPATQTLIGSRAAALAGSRALTGSQAPAGNQAPAGGARPKSTFTSSDSADHGRFLPGTLLLDRYRVTALLGRGGMGEVYRADDMKLGQTVALKFLPPDLAADPGRLARFHNETRLARQVSHPNVCRVYDIGDLDGQVFMSMEYIDGEDLGTLLRRIGRLPKDKAVEISRQICAGLAAAHDRGVLHRDLKPSNVMIDGRGRARIADFGLAGLAGGAEGEGTRAGTPAYMAPEHINSGATSVRSDLYALGLVLYELFTGRRAFDGDSIADLARKHRDDPPTPPSSLVEEFDPTIERVILRCLEKDPHDRPASALAIAAALPGGDPLAMALAAGETPSPEMVAAAGETGGLSPAMVWVCLLAIVAGIGLLVPLAAGQTLAQTAAPMKPPAVLTDRARDLIAKFGWPDPPAGSASGVGYHRSYLEHLRERGRLTRDSGLLARPRPSLLFFWYRQSPRPLVPANPHGTVSDSDPPMTIPGMTSVQVSGSGDLWRFFAIPPQRDESTGPPPRPVDWSPFFAEAGLQAADFEPVEPEWSPPGYADTRVAWTGHYADTPEWPVRVEAASYRGRAVAFQVLWPWNRPLLMRPFEDSMGRRLADGIVAVLVALAIFAGLVIARRNIRQGKGDRRGAFRLAVAVFAATFAGTYLNAGHHARAIQEWELVMLLASGALFDAGVTWLYYIALEPHVRKRWPDRIIAWTRLVAGRVRDPLVGREVLLGAVLGVGLALINALVRGLSGRFGWPAAPPIGDVDWLLSPARALAAILHKFGEITGQALVLLFLVVFLRALLRRGSAAMLVFGLIIAGILTLDEIDQIGALAVVSAVAGAAILTLAIGRVGLLALVVTLFSARTLVGLPIAADTGAWYAAAAALPLLVLALVVAWAARAALAGRSLLDVRLFAD